MHITYPHPQEVLDYAGEWFLDVQEGALYMIPPTGKSVESLTLVPVHRPTGPPPPLLYNIQARGYIYIYIYMFSHYFQGGARAPGQTRKKKDRPESCDNISLPAVFR